MVPVGGVWHGCQTQVMLLVCLVRCWSIAALLICPRAGWKPQINETGELWLLFSMQELPSTRE